jgi:phage terminase small subunit
MARSKLTDKQSRFVAEYLVDSNATKAAIRAGYSPRTAEWIGPQLLGKSHVIEAIRLKQSEIAGRLEITAERVLKERARLAFFDPRKLFNPDGSPKAIHELDDDTAAVIAGLDVVSVGNAEVGVGQILKYKIVSKDGALAALEKHLGLYEKDNEQASKRVLKMDPQLTPEEAYKRLIGK